MSDEIRDLLRGRANDVPVPAGDLGDVVRGGNARRWRNRAYSVGVVVLVAAVAWATVPGFLGSMRDEGRAPNIADTPTPGPTESPEAGACDEVPFRPTYLPEGWSYLLHRSSSQISPDTLGYYTIAADGTIEGRYVEIHRYGEGYSLPSGEGAPIEVLGTEGRIGHVEDGNTVEFSYNGCEYSLMAFGIPKGELGRIARALRATDTCKPKIVNGRTLNLGDGRFFGYIRALNENAVEFDVAEMLSGAEANEAAIEAGVIEAGDTVPNDYFIVNEDRATGRFPLSPDVNVLIETLQDGMVGLAPADLGWLMCEFVRGPRDDLVNHWHSPYWLTVKNGRVVEIEEQYLP